MYNYLIQISKIDINALTKHMLRDYVVYGPTLKSRETDAKQKEYFSFEQIKTADALRLNYDTSLLPPVKTFFPNNEKLVSFNLNDINKSKKVLEASHKILFGVHTCDLHSIQLMDKIFNNDPVDENYISRRKDSIIIGLSCKAPCREATLCYDKGTYKADKSGASIELCDIMMWENGSYYILEVRTQVGQRLIEKYDFFKPFKSNFNEFISSYEEEQHKTFKSRLVNDVKGLKEAIKQSYNSNIWNEEAEKCLSCGACNFVCPTCYCFDTYDDVDLSLEEGYRCRKWDACQDHDFSCIGSGENFREKSAQRNRHRIFKKEVYIHDKYGVSGCVGCGRCNDICVANVSLIDIYNRAFIKEII